MKVRLAEMNTTMPIQLYDATVKFAVSSYPSRVKNLLFIFHDRPANVRFNCSS